MKKLKACLLVAVIAITGIKPVQAQLSDPTHEDDRIGYDVKPDDIHEGPVSATEHELAEVEIYPQPCNDFVKLRFSFEQNRQFEIYDLQGRNVLSFIGKEQEVEVPTASLPPGHYVIRQGSHSWRIIKE